MRITFVDSNNDKEVISVTDYNQPINQGEEIHIYGNSYEVIDIVKSFDIDGSKVTVYVHKLIGSILNG